MNLLQIGIGDNRKTCWIMKDANNRSSATVPNVITPKQYRKFWITWAGGLIKLGCDGESIPLVTLIHEFPNLSYVTFGVLKQLNPVDWRLERKFRAANVLWSWL